MKQSFNINLGKLDKLKDYEQCKILCINAVPETTKATGDEENIFKIAKALEISLDQYDIHHAPCLGKLKKFKPIIV